MKRHLNILFICIAFLSCESINKTVRESYSRELYIDYKYVSYQGRNSSQTLYFEIDSVNGVKSYGKLIIDNKDTLIFNCFKKGSHYVTPYRLPNTQNGGRLEIWSRGETGQIRDSITIEDSEKVNGIIKEKTTLYRKPRKVCH